ncbi:hypothetical protein [Absidia glauca]|uniref:Casein kinase II subunit beta n=1 Tax=Absidia glauca TaxID=4829 RepID=A0A163K5T4_ABSGL|nr:hypothetical protein [Absidia glauca]
MEDNFNLTGLSSVVPYYQDALEMILDLEANPDEQNDDDPIITTNSYSDAGLLRQLPVAPEEDDGLWKEDVLEKRRGRVEASVIEPYARMLYGLIHQRYITTRNGLRLMAERYASEVFGTCPRFYCAKCPVIPIGRYDEAGIENVKLYCPCCLDIYNPSSIYLTVDGAHFGTSYAHLMFQSFKELVPLARPHIYQPKISGFRVNERSRSGPRMQWLRMRPPQYIDPNDTDDYDNDDQDDIEHPDQLDEEEDQIRSYQVIEHTTDNLSQVAGQMEDCHLQESSINGFLRRWI